MNDDSHRTPRDRVNNAFDAEREIAWRTARQFATWEQYAAERYLSTLCETPEQLAELRLLFERGRGVV